MGTEPYWKECDGNDLTVIIYIFRPTIEWHMITSIKKSRVDLLYHGNKNNIPSGRTGCVCAKYTIYYILLPYLYFRRLGTSKCGELEFERWPCVIPVNRQGSEGYPTRNINTPRSQTLGHDLESHSQQSPIIYNTVRTGYCKFPKGCGREPSPWTFIFLPELGCAITFTEGRITYKCRSEESDMLYSRAKEL